MEVPVLVGDDAAAEPDDQCASGRPVQQHRQQGVVVVVEAGEGAGAVGHRLEAERVVVGQVPHGPAVEDLDVLVGRVGGVDQAWRLAHGGQRRDQRRGHEPARRAGQAGAQAQRHHRQQEAGEDQDRLGGAQKGNEHQHRQERSEHAADGRDAEDAARRGAHLALPRQLPHKERAGHAHHDDRRREEHQDAQQRAHEHERERRVQPGQRASQPPQQRHTEERQRQEPGAGAQQQLEQGGQVALPVGQPAADHVADRERDHDHADDVGPHVGRRAEHRRHQARGAQLDRHDRHARTEREHVRIPGSARAARPSCVCGFPDRQHLPVPSGCAVRPKTV